MMRYESSLIWGAVWINIILLVSRLETSLGRVTECSYYEGKVILAFGDSLTHGSSTPYRKPHPYAIKLKEYMPLSNIVEMGVPGEVTSSMMERLKVTLHKTNDVPSVVVLLGGTNDIGRGLSNSVIVSNIIRMHDDIRLLKLQSPEKYGVMKHTILMTIPRMTNDRFRKNRIQINHELRNYVAKSASDYDGFTLLMDIENVFAFTPCIPSGINDLCQPRSFNVTNTQYWDRDSPLHFSPQGYDRIGEMVFQTLCEGESVFV